MTGTGDGSDLSSRPSGDQGRRACYTVLEEKLVDHDSKEKVIACYRFEMCALTNVRKGSLGEYSPSFYKMQIAILKDKMFNFFQDQGVTNHKYYKLMIFQVQQ